MALFIRRSIVPIAQRRAFHLAAVARMPAGPNTNAPPDDDVRKMEDAHEKEYITRHEREVLMTMMERMERAADPEGKKSKTEVSKILKEHGLPGTNVNSGLIEALAKWRMTPIASPSDAARP